MVFNLNFIVMKLHEKSLLGSRVYGFNTFRGCSSIDYPENEMKPVLEEDTKSSVDAILDSIFSIDPRTKLPTGDIAVFMNKNTSDEVKKYIRDNLLSDNGGVSDSSKYGSLPDSVIADYARNTGETIYQYRDRIIDVMRKNYSEYKNDKNDKS